MNKNNLLAILLVLVYHPRHSTSLRIGRIHGLPGPYSRRKTSQSKPKKSKLSASITKEEVDYLVREFNKLSPKQIRKVKSLNLERRAPSARLSRKEKRLIFESIKRNGKDVLFVSKKNQTRCLRLYVYFESILNSLGRVNPNCVDKIDFIEDSLVFYDDYILRKYRFDITKCFSLELESRIC